LKEVADYQGANKNHKSNKNVFDICRDHDWELSNHSIIRYKRV